MPTEPNIYLTRGSEGCLLAVRRHALTIVVDALRASTTLAVLFDRGAERVLVVAEVADARALAARIPGALLAGERGGERLPGFDFGNSPLEVLAAPRLDGRTVVFTSSNGAQRLAAVCGTDCTLIGTVANAAAVAAEARRAAEFTNGLIVFVAAGKYPDETFVSPEDDAACAYLAARIGLPIAAESRDAVARLQTEIARRGLEEIFYASDHAQHLVDIGYGDDVAFCARPDTCRAIPTITAPLVMTGRLIGAEVRTVSSAGDGRPPAK
ncbi:MAG: 2-phosphosulfolactate phosphatase [Armatimonadota bacterium]